MATVKGTIYGQEMTEASSEHPHADLVRRAHQAFESGDAAAVRELFHEDIRWVMPGRSQVSGVDHGLPEVMANFQRCMELTNGTYRAVGVDYLGSDRHAVALSHLSAERDGKVLELDECVIFEVVDGKLANAFHLPYDQYAWDEFFGTTT